MNSAASGQAICGGLEWLNDDWSSIHGKQAESNSHNLVRVDDHSGQWLIHVVIAFLLLYKSFTISSLRVFDKKKEKKRGSSSDSSAFASLLGKLDPNMNFTMAGWI